MSLIEVADATYYHINQRRDGPNNELLKVGQEIEIGENLNPRTWFEEEHKVPCYDLVDDEGNPQTPVKLINSVIGKQISAPADNFPTFILETVTNLNQTVRELVFEEVRQAEFSHLPSRRTCIWLTKSKEEIKKWKETFKPYGELTCSPSSYQS